LSSEVQNTVLQEGFLSQSDMADYEKEIKELLGLT
jgi:hypothetical protein